MSKFCVNCGTEIEEGAAVCPSCGQAAEVQSEQEIQTVPQSGEIPEDVLEARKWTSYKGRLNRKRYILRAMAFVIMTVVLAIVGGIIAAVVGMNVKDTTDPTFQILLYAICSPVIVLMIMNNIKRLHDLDKPGWLVIIGLIPIQVIQFAFGVYLLFFKGTEGENKYGNDQLMY